jgi:hypothetical protein
MEKYYFNFCHYGNIHLTQINETAIPDEIITGTGFTVIAGNEETDNFTEDGKIKGRRLKL